MQGRGHPAVDASSQGYSQGMQGVLGDRPAWYVLGPLIGLVVLGLLLAINERFGVLGGYSNVVERVTRRSPVLGWKGWLLVGVLGGSLVFRLVAGGRRGPPGARRAPRPPFRRAPGRAGRG